MLKQNENNNTIVFSLSKECKCCWQVTSNFLTPSVSILGGTPPNVRIDFQNSSNCGGPASARQFVSLSNNINVLSETTLNIDINGLIEAEDAGFERIEVIVDENLVASSMSVDDNYGCTMKPVNSGDQPNKSGSIDLCPGCHSIKITADTIDGQYHAGAYYTVNFSASGGQIETCENQYKLCCALSGFQAFNGSNKWFKRLALYDLDCCFLEYPPLNLQRGRKSNPAISNPNDGYYIIEKEIVNDCPTGRCVVVESVRWYGVVLPVGTIIPCPQSYDKIPAVQGWALPPNQIFTFITVRQLPPPTATFASLTTDGNCCNSNGSKVYAELTDEIPTPPPVNWPRPFNQSGWVLDAAAPIRIAVDHASNQQIIPPPSPPPQTLEQQDPDGPGTKLSQMLEKIGIKASPTCSCKARARLMNEKGYEWCEEHIDEIVGWLKEEATKRKLPFIDAAGRLLIRRAISLSKKAKQSKENK